MSRNVKEIKKKDSDLNQKFFPSLLLHWKKVEGKKKTPREKGRDNASVSLSLS